MADAGNHPSLASQPAISIFVWLRGFLRRLARVLSENRRKQCRCSLRSQQRLLLYLAGTACAVIGWFSFIQKYGPLDLVVCFSARMIQYVSERNITYIVFLIRTVSFSHFSSRPGVSYSGHKSQSEWRKAQFETCSTALELGQYPVIWCAMLIFFKVNFNLFSLVYGEKKAAKSLWSKTSSIGIKVPHIYSLLASAV